MVSASYDQPRPTIYIIIEIIPGHQTHDIFLLALYKHIT